jgi:pyridinium-3,5-bisthiocarboxylic acid mononucleotide nickel chelatase
LIGWLDCGSGASGDMLLGVLVDSGVPLDHLRATVNLLPVEEIGLRAERVQRHALAATKIHVDAPESHHHRTFRDIRAMLGGAGLPAAVHDAALAAFGRLARAEGAVHGTDPEDVHFHEVGALDAIADIVGACAGVAWLREHRGLTRLAASAVALGGGRARGAHGSIPVPGPAVLRLAAAAEVPVTGANLPYEACTPTGMALLATLVDGGFGGLPPMVVRSVGMGAGGRDPDETANVIRLVLGDPQTRSATETALVLSCNVDDLDPRLWPGVLAALLAAGAADAWLTPILMKKGRPAHTLSVLCGTDRAAALRAVIYEQTSTIGVREVTVAKYPLAREQASVDVDGQPVRLKIARHGDTVVNVSVEYDDVAAAAAALGMPAKQVLARATAAAHRPRPHA